MDLKKKIILIVASCIILCVGAAVMINNLFNKIEAQLLEKCRIEAVTGARAMSEIMKLMIERNLLSRDDIFDTNYKPIEGSRPQKFLTRFDKVFDEYIQKIQDEFLLDPDVNFAILIDKNGYVPTHNSKYALPLSGDYQKDLQYSRSKRNYANSPAIKGALEYNGTGTIQLYYFRDTGERMWNIGAPVKVDNKHWGAFLVGVSLQRIDAIKNQMIILIITVMFVILSLTMLAILSVIPRKFFDPEKPEGDGQAV